MDCFFLIKEKKKNRFRQYKMY
uniref:Uncharacterized protein n=1 Tax=Anguilla anguilla TaxID=7936 RepID=A0A0E9RZT5_ANGAN